MTTLLLFIGGMGFGFLLGRLCLWLWAKTSWGKE